MDYDYQKMIVSLRNKLILSQEDFAKLLGVSFASLNRWETGKIRPSKKAEMSLEIFCKKNQIKFDDNN